MSQTSPTLSLPYIQPAQAQKHVTHNEALRILDAVTQLSVISTTLTIPPAQTAEGDRYIVADAATGVWAGQETHVAVRVGNSLCPIPGGARISQAVVKKYALTVPIGKA